MVSVATMAVMGAVGSGPAVLVRLGVLAVLVGRQLIGRGTVLGSSVAGMVLMSCHVASPR
jgi:hypothetical protein